MTADPPFSGFRFAPFSPKPTVRPLVDTLFCLVHGERDAFYTKLRSFQLAHTMRSDTIATH